MRFLKNVFAVAGGAFLMGEIALSLNTGEISLWRIVPPFVVGILIAIIEEDRI